MTQDDARNFIVALNSIVPYVPPMLMQPLVTSPCAKLIQQVANTPQQEQQHEQSIERPKPHAVP